MSRSLAAGRSGRMPSSRSQSDALPERAGSSATVVISLLMTKSSIKNIDLEYELDHRYIEAEGSEDLLIATERNTGPSDFPFRPSRCEPEHQSQKSATHSPSTLDIIVNRHGRVACCTLSAVRYQSGALVDCTLLNPPLSRTNVADGPDGHAGRY